MIEPPERSHGADTDLAARADGAAAPVRAGDQIDPGAKPAEAGWYGIAHVSIGNYAIIRRNHGRGATRRAFDTLISEIERHPDVSLLEAGRDIIEFAFPAGDLNAIERFAETIWRQLEACCEELVQGDPLVLHLGVAAGPIGQCDETRLVEAAESAATVAAGTGGFHLIDLSRVDLAFDSLTLMRELRRAIEQGEMFLHYQPKLNVRQQRIAGVEALIRWQHPTRGLILPGDFISVAEKADEIGALTLWTLRQVIADQRRMADAGHDIPVFINVSGVLLADSAFVAEACAIIDGNSEARLGFEITETAVIQDPDSAIRHLKQFADSGIALAIDDYGAGLSSLAYLKQLPAKELKIDKMFVTNLTSSNRDPLIVRSTIDLAHALEMEVTAEGVETPSALALLSVMGCDMVQGYLISRPIPLDALLAYLDDQLKEDREDRLASPFIRPESLWKRA
ncbi:EAL domain-containing protein [Sphingomonas sp. RS6]